MMRMRRREEFSRVHSASFQYNCYDDDDDEEEDDEEEDDEEDRGTFSGSLCQFST